MDGNEGVDEQEVDDNERVDGNEKADGNDAAGVLNSRIPHKPFPHVLLRFIDSCIRSKFS